MMLVRIDPTDLVSHLQSNCPAHTLQCILLDLVELFVIQRHFHICATHMIVSMVSVWCL